jgi:phage shock protein A
MSDYKNRPLDEIDKVTLAVAIDNYKNKNIKLGSNHFDVIIRGYIQLQAEHQLVTEKYNALNVWAEGKGISLRLAREKNDELQVKVKLLQDRDEVWRNKKRMLENDLAKLQAELTATKELLENTTEEVRIWIEKYKEATIKVPEIQKQLIAALKANERFEGCYAEDCPFWKYVNQDKKESLEAKEKAEKDLAQYKEWSNAFQTGLESANKEIERLEKEVERQKLSACCLYCGQTNIADKPENKLDMMINHMASCEKHPLATLLCKIENLKFEFVEWAKDHYWDSVEKDRDIIIKHIKDNWQSDNMTREERNEMD